MWWEVVLETPCWLGIFNSPLSHHHVHPKVTGPCPVGHFSGSFPTYSNSIERRKVLSHLLIDFFFIELANWRDSLDIFCLHLVLQITNVVILRYVCQFLKHVRLFATPWTVVCQVPLSMGFSSQEYWSRLPFPSLGDLPDPGIKSASFVSPALAGGFSTTVPPRKTVLKYSWCIILPCLVEKYVRFTSKLYHILPSWRDLNPFHYQWVSLTYKANVRWGREISICSG